LPEALDEARSWLGIERPRFEKAEKTYRRPAKPKCTPPRSAVREYLTQDRHLSEATIAAYRIGEDGRTIIFPSLLPNGELAAVKYLGIDRSPDGKKITRVEAGCEPILFGWQAIDRNARTIAITEGEIDALSAWDYGHPALSVPFGGGIGAKQQWIEREFDRLAQFEMILLALDMDEPGEQAAQEIAERLGRHRCRRVRLPAKDLNECRKLGISKGEIDECFAQAEAMDPPELRRAGAFTEDVLGLFWPAGGHEPGYVLPWSSVRDKVLFRPGEMTIWTGATGAGKSQALSHALVGMGEQGARVCVASLEMAPKQLLKRMVKQAGNIDRPSEPHLREIMGWLDCWCWLFAHLGKADAKTLLASFEYARARYGCDVFVIDSLMRLGVGSEDYEGQERAVFEITSWAVEKSVHVHLVAHARKADKTRPQAAPDSEDVKGTSEIASNAANILGIARNRDLEEKLRRARASNDSAAEADMADKPPVTLNVAKQRNGDWEGRLGLWFDTLSYQYRSKEDPQMGITYVPVPDRGWEPPQ